MQFLAIVHYSHGGRITHEFRCPLERAAFVRTVRQRDPQAQVRLKFKKDIQDDPPPDEGQWYDPRQTSSEGGTIE